MSYPVVVQHVTARPFASVPARMPARDIPTRFRQFLDQVYAAAKSHALALDGQNIFVYRARADQSVDVEFGVGARAPFDAVGAVTYSEVPGGEVATTTHWGDYGMLGGAHDAVVSWCRAEGRTLAGVSWEVYGHWSDDPTARRTDVFYLLA
ncbi:MAG: GyrI-like domain-containing protein [bacterium]